MNNNIEISIIIVSWNAKKYLHACLQSIEKEISDFSSEIIVVDNFSTDGSRELIIENYPKVILISNSKNLGFSKANNLGISRSHGRYILLVNSDIEIMPGCIRKLINFMVENNDVGMVAPKIVGVDGKMQRSCMRFPTLWNNFVRALALDRIMKKSNKFRSYLDYTVDKKSPQEVEVINGCFWVIRRTALEHVGLLDETFFIYGEDIDWCRRFRDSSWKVVYFPAAEALHYGGGSSSNAPVRFFLEMHRANLQYWKKYHGKTDQLMYVLISCLNLTIRILANIVILSLNMFKNDKAVFNIKRSAYCLGWYIGLQKIESL